MCRNSRFCLEKKGLDFWEKLNSPFDSCRSPLALVRGSPGLLKDGPPQHLQGLDYGTSLVKGPRYVLLWGNNTVIELIQVLKTINVAFSI